MSIKISCLVQVNKTPKQATTTTKTTKKNNQKQNKKVNKQIQKAKS